MILHETMLDYLAQMEYMNAKEDVKKDRLEWSVPHQGKLLERGVFPNSVLKEEVKGDMTN